MVFTVEQIEKIKATAIAATEELRGDYGPIGEIIQQHVDQQAAKKAAREANPTSKEAQTEQAIMDIPVCNDGKRAICKLVKVLTGIDVNVPEEIDTTVEQEFIPYSIVVPTRNENSHDYTLGIPIMMVGPGDISNTRAINMGGLMGNNVQWIESGLRPATDEEVAKFFRVWEVLAIEGMDLGCKGITLFDEKTEEAS